MSPLLRPKGPRATASRAPWAIALRRARLEEGVSQRELARRLGVAQETVRAAELGRPPRHSTLMAYLLALPTLRAADLLPAPPTAPVATPATWRWFRDLNGFSVRRLRIERRRASGSRDELSVEALGVATQEPALLLEPKVLLALAQSVSTGDAGSLAERFDALGAPPWTLSFDDARGRHEIAVTIARGGPALSYRHVGLVERTDVLEHALDVPVEVLELVLEGAGATPYVRPEPIPLDDADPRLERRMYPDTVLRRSRERTTWRVPRPLPGFAHGLRADVAPPRSRPARRALATTLSAAREEARLSLRDVASIARTAHASLAYAEAGRDCRASTLAAYLRALPELSPQELLPAVCEAGEATDEDAWTEMRGLYGYEIALLRKTFTIASDGSSTNVVETLGLKPLRDDLRDFRVRAGLHRAITGASESVLQSVETEHAEAKVRLVRREDGAQVHEFRFPRRLGQGSLSHVRTFRGASYPLTASASRTRQSPDEEIVSGVMMAVYHPARRAKLVVSLPAGFSPRYVRTLAYPTSVPGDPDRPPLSAKMTAPPCRIERTEEAFTLTLSVERPAIGTRVGVTWGVPE